jgi:hypothetical protein
MKFEISITGSSQATEFLNIISQKNNVTPVGNYTLNGWGALFLSTYYCNTHPKMQAFPYK